MKRQWTCIYAPILPSSMIQILQAVIPYLVGIQTKYKDMVMSSMDLNDKVIVDLDEDTIYCPQDVSIIVNNIIVIIRFLDCFLTEISCGEDN